MAPKRLVSSDEEDSPRRAPARDPDCMLPLGGRADGGRCNPAAQPAAPVKRAEPALVSVFARAAAARAKRPRSRSPPRRDADGDSDSASDDVLVARIAAPLRSAAAATRNGGNAGADGKAGLVDKAMPLRRSTRTRRKPAKALYEDDDDNDDDDDDDDDDDVEEVSVRRASKGTPRGTPKGTPKGFPKGKGRKKGRRGKAAGDDKAEDPGASQDTASQGTASQDPTSQDPASQISPPSSQPLKLRVSALKMTKRQRDEHARAMEGIRRERMDEEELSRIRIAFTHHYPPPPSNMEAHGRYEVRYGRSVTDEQADFIWKTELKPWSDRWWLLYDKFSLHMRAKKMLKPLDRSTKVSVRECERNAKAFYKEHGDARLKEGNEEVDFSQMHSVPAPAAAAADVANTQQTALSDAGLDGGSTPQTPDKDAAVADPPARSVEDAIVLDTPTDSGHGARTNRASTATSPPSSPRGSAVIASSAVASSSRFGVSTKAGASKSARSVSASIAKPGKKGKAARRAESVVVSLSSSPDSTDTPAHAPPRRGGLRSTTGAQKTGGIRLNMPSIVASKSKASKSASSLASPPAAKFPEEAVAALGILKASKPKAEKSAYSPAAPPAAKFPEEAVAAPRSLKTYVETLTLASDNASGRSRGSSSKTVTPPSSKPVASSVFDSRSVPEVDLCKSKEEKSRPVERSVFDQDPGQSVARSLDITQSESAVEADPSSAGRAPCAAIPGSIFPADSQAPSDVGRGTKDVGKSFDPRHPGGDGRTVFATHVNEGPVTPEVQTVVDRPYRIPRKNPEASEKTVVPWRTFPDASRTSADFGLPVLPLPARSPTVSPQMGSALGYNALLGSARAPNPQAVDYVNGYNESGVGAGYGNGSVAQGSVGVARSPQYVVDASGSHPGAWPPGSYSNGVWSRSEDMASRCAAPVASRQPRYGEVQEPTAVSEVLEDQGCSVELQGMARHPKPLARFMPGASSSPNKRPRFSGEMAMSSQVHRAGSGYAQPPNYAHTGTPTAQCWDRYLAGPTMPWAGPPQADMGTASHLGGPHSAHPRNDAPAGTPGAQNFSGPQGVPGWQNRY